MPTNTQGKLFIVATPIGNLDDVSLRMLKILQEVDCILCEDTRVVKRLLTRHGMHKPLISLHENNEYAKTPSLIKDLQAGTNYALLSDAGTPTISDPGRLLISSALSAAIKVIPLPGANAAISALSCSGFNADSFVFEGFLPAKSIARRHRIEDMKNEMRTLIFYEAPHRIEKMICDIIDIFGAQRKACLCKELTKIHETVISDTLAGIQKWLAEEAIRCKGEFVVVVQGNDTIEVDNENQVNLLRALLQYLSPGQAAGIVAKVNAGNKNNLYKMALEIKAETDRVT